MVKKGRRISLFSKGVCPNSEEILATTSSLKYKKNAIITSRYTLISFLPKSLLEQFRRLANVYFLVLGIIATIGSYTKFYETAVQPYGILGPMFIVIFISMIKEGVEDYKRHRTDALISAKKTRIVNSSDSMTENVIFTEWQHLKVGDIILLLRDDEIPADIVILACGGVQGNLAYVETAAIDGETNLKVKTPSLTRENGDASIVEESIHVFQYNEFPIFVNQSRDIVKGLETLKDRMVIEAEPPNEMIYTFNGFMRIASTTQPNPLTQTLSLDMSFSPPSHLNVDVLALAPEIIPLSEKNLLLRGSVIRATEWCVGVVAYTGEDTKLSLNSKTPPSKLSSVDRIVNRTLFIAIAVMVMVCIISMIFNIIWLSNNSQAFYLCLDISNLNGVYPGGGGCQSSATISELTIFTFATLYNNFVCISMYVSLEMVYLCQAYFISQDKALYDEASDTPAECHSSGMCADLGQVQYVLSDKTGTLTKNVMKLRRCSLAGQVFGAPIEVPLEVEAEASKVGSARGTVSRMHVHEEVIEISVSSTVSSTGSTVSSTVSKEKEKVRVVSCNHPGLPSQAVPSAPSSSSSSSSTHASCSSHTQAQAWQCPWRPLDQMHPSCLSPSSAPSPALQQMAVDFFRVLTVCNTVMLMPDDQGQVCVRDYMGLESCLQAESADEVALVLAAAQHCGVLLTSRTGARVTVRGLHGEPGSGHGAGAGDGDVECVKVLAVNEFESDRKRMSVLVRIGTRYMLLCKGADSSMVTNCRVGAYTSTCLEHVEAFAVTGLRTLIASKRDLTEEYVLAWMKEYNHARSSIFQRAERLSECAHAIEREMDLLGALGIEDELQDGAPGAIQVLRQAGVNVWMITGDKAETAFAIGKMCSLISPDHTVERVLGLSGPELRQRLGDIQTYLDRETGGMRASVAVKYRSHLALLIDGTSLEGIWTASDMKLIFSSIAHHMPTVIACRVSPLQKAALVRMIKSSPARPITLAIGDGANDVGMIHEARVGVGISGKEGRHAANSADFAISQFKFLVPLLLEHGRYNYIRCSKLVLYSFFKNLLLVSVLFYFCLYSGFSGTVPLDSLVFSGYNFYLGLPVIALGSLDWDVPRKYVYTAPGLAYNTGRLGELLNLWNMLRWCLFAFVQGLLLFTMCIRILGGPVTVSTRHQSGYSGYIGLSGLGLQTVSNGWSGGMFVEGFLLYSTAVVTMQYKIIAMTCTRTWITWAAVLISMGGYVLFNFAYGLFSSLDWFNVLPLTLQMTEFWIAILCVPVMIHLSDVIVERFMSNFFPSSQDKLRSMYERDRRHEDLLSLKSRTSSRNYAGTLGLQQITTTK